MSPGHQVTLNMAALANDSLSFPFIDQAKLNDGTGFTINGANFNINPGFATSAWSFGANCVDSDGQPNASIPNCTLIAFKCYLAPSISIPAGYTRVGEPWVLRWVGDPSATVAITNASSQTTRSANIIDFVWQSDTDNTQFSFTSFNTANCPRKWNVYRLSNEAAFLAGETIDPDYAATVSPGTGRLRTMQPQQTIFNLFNNTFASYPTEANWSYVSPINQAGFPKGGGMPPSIIAKLGNKMGRSLHVCSPCMLGNGKAGQIAFATQSNPCVITNPYNTFVNGDTLTINQVSGMTQLNFPTTPYTVGNVGVHGVDTFELVGVDSTGFGAFTPSNSVGTVTFSGSPGAAVVAGRFSNNEPLTFTNSGGALPTGIVANKVYWAINTVPGVSCQLSTSITGTTPVTISSNGSGTTTAFYSGAGGFLWSPFSLSGMTTEIGLFAASFLANVTSGQPTCFEFDNECWNGSWTVFAWLRAQNRLWTAGNPTGNGSQDIFQGYLAAHLMRIVYDTYGAGNRSKWKGLLGTFVETSLLNDQITGINMYYSDFPSYAGKLFDEVSTQGYWGLGVFETPNSTISPVTFSGSPSTAVITFPAGQNPDTSTSQTRGWPIRFSGGTLPTPLVAGTIYWTGNSSGDTSNIAATFGGTPLTISNNGSGTITATICMHDVTDGWITTSTARWLAALEPTEYSYFSRMVNAAARDGSVLGGSSTVDCVTNLVNLYWSPIVAIATANGLGTSMYEGGNFVALFGLQGVGRYSEFMDNSQHNADDAANYPIMFDAFLAAGGIFPSKYTADCSIHRANVSTNWAALPFVGNGLNGTSAEWQAIVSWNQFGLTGHCRNIKGHF